MIINKPILGNCLDVMKDIPDESIDLIVTDPPYNISTKGKVIKRYNAKDIKLDFGEWDQNVIMPQDYLEIFHKKLTDYGVLIMFYNQYQISTLGTYMEKKYGYKVRVVGAWVKPNPVPRLMAFNWMCGLEHFVIVTKNEGNGHHFNKDLKQSPNYFVHNVNYDHLHPTQKPLSLMRWLIKYWSYKGDLILDPFLGSGTTGLAALEENRRFIGIEQNKEFYDIAVKRIAGYKGQGRLW